MWSYPPTIRMPTHIGHTVNQFVAMEMPSASRKKILWDNCARLYRVKLGSLIKKLGEHLTHRTQCRIEKLFNGSEILFCALCVFASVRNLIGAPTLANNPTPCVSRFLRFFLIVLRIWRISLRSQQAETLGYDSLWLQERIIGDSTMLEPIRLLNFAGRDHDQITVGNIGYLPAVAKSFQFESLLDPEYHRRGSCCHGSWARWRSSRVPRRCLRLHARRAGHALY